MNMQKWTAELIASPVKKALPVLSFPSAQLMGVSVRELILSAENQARGMRLIAERVDSAAAVSLMDLSVEAECFGSEVRFSDNEVPTIVGSVVSSEEDAEKLTIPPIGAGRTGLCVEAIRRAAAEINDRPVLAGVIGPYSLTGRLMDVTEVMIACLDEPELVHSVLEKTTEFIISYCRAFKAAGADGVVLAEPLAGLLSPAMAAEFSSAYVGCIVAAVQDEDFAVVYHNCGNGTVRMADSIVATGASLLHFGDAIDMAEMLEKIPATIPVLGNISPARELRGGTPESVRAATLELLARCSKYPNFVISSGCDIPPLAPWENIDAFFAAVEEFYGR